MVITQWVLSLTSIVCPMKDLGRFQLLIIWRFHSNFGLGRPRSRVLQIYEDLTKKSVKNEISDIKTLPKFSYNCVDQYSTFSISKKEGLMY